MAMLPQSNARLLSVTRGESSEDYDQPAVSIPPIWQGSLDAYVQQKLVATFNPRGALERVLQVTLIVSGDIPIRLQSGDVLTYAAGSGEASRVMTGRIQNVINPAFLPTIPDYYKCALEPPSAPQEA